MTVVSRGADGTRSAPQDLEVAWSASRGVSGAPVCKYRYVCALIRDGLYFWGTVRPAGRQEGRRVIEVCRKATDHPFTSSALLSDSREK